MDACGAVFETEPTGPNIAIMSLMASFVVIVGDGPAKLTGVPLGAWATCADCALDCDGFAKVTGVAALMPVKLLKAAG